MAEETEEEISFTPAEAGFAFKAEMWAVNTLLGYWKHLTLIIVVVLIGVLFYGQWNLWVQKSQRGATARIADMEKELPTSMPQLSMLVQSGDEKASPEALTAVAVKLEAISAEESGTASAEAALKAAELYRLAGATDKQRQVLEKAASGSRSGPLHYAAEAALANLDLAEDQGDQAVKRLRALVDQNEGFLAEQAALDLGLALEHLERTDEANKVYAEFVTKWPDSPRTARVKDRQAQLSGGEG